MLYAGIGIHRKCYTHKVLYPESVLHRKCYTQKVLFTESVIHRKCYSHKVLYTKCHTQKLLHTESVIHRKCYTHHFGLFSAHSEEEEEEISAILEREASQPEDETLCAEQTIIDSVLEELSQAADGGVTPTWPTPPTPLSPRGSMAEDPSQNSTLQKMLEVLRAHPPIG